MYARIKLSHTHTHAHIRTHAHALDCESNYKWRYILCNISVVNNSRILHHCRVSLHAALKIDIFVNCREHHIVPFKIVHLTLRKRRSAFIPFGHIKIIAMTIKSIAPYHHASNNTNSHGGQLSTNFSPYLILARTEAAGLDWFAFLYVRWKQPEE